MSETRAKISIDSAGSEAFNGVFGESIAEQRHSDVQVQFQYNYFDEQFDVKPEESTGDGTSTVSGSMAIVSSAITGTVMRSSLDSIRYRPGHTGFAYGTASFDGTGVGKAGCFDLPNGFILKVINNVASFGYLKSGVETGSLGAAGLDNQAVWNGNKDISEIDLTKVNIFLITFGYLGVANPTLWIKKDKWYVLHTVKTEGVLTGTHVDTPVFPISIYAENGMTVKSGSWYGGTIGEGADIGSRGFSFPNTLLISGAGAEQNSMTLSGTNVGTIVLFKAKTNYQGKPNKVKVRLLGFSFYTDIPAGNVTGSVIFQIVGVSALSGVASYSDINLTSSVMEYDHTNGAGASVNVSSGAPILTKIVDYVGSSKGGFAGAIILESEKLGAFAYADDVFGVIAKDKGGNDVTVRVELHWEELF